MIALISPSKTLDTVSNGNTDFTLPSFLEESVELASILKKKSKNKLQNLMGISEKLALINVERYQNFESKFTLKNSKQSVLSFKGDVYLGLAANDFNKTELKYAQKHLRILSGLYGLLRPMDLMQAYRLEMGIKLKNKKGANLYEFWGDKITDLLNEQAAESKAKAIVNLASKEYFKSVRVKMLNIPVLDIDFREYKGEDLKFISFNAKKARGLMCRYMVKNRLKKTNDLKGFDYEGYSFSEELSTETKWLFVR